VRFSVVDERLCAVAALQQERLTAGDVGQQALSRSISAGTVTGGTLSRTVRIALADSASQPGCCAAGLARAASSRCLNSSGSGGSGGSWSMGTSTVQFTHSW
jgi:hypothetical protein